MAEFTNTRKVTSEKQLTPIQAEQVRLCGIAYDRENLPASERLSTEEISDEETVLNFCELWDVIVDGSLAYEVWFYQGDSGSVFRAGTAEMVAEIIQCCLRGCADKEMELQLGMAMVKADLLPVRDSDYERYLAALNEAR